MPNITQQEPGAANAVTPETMAVRTLVTWRHKDKAALGDKSNRDKQRAEYQARNELRHAADGVEIQAGQP